MLLGLFTVKLYQYNYLAMDNEINDNQTNRTSPTQPHYQAHNHRQCCGSPVSGL